MFPTSGEYLIGISDECCLLFTGIRHLAHVLTVPPPPPPNKSVPTLRYTRRHERHALTECSPLDFRSSSHAFIAGLHVLGCRVDILGTNWLNVDDDEVMLNVLRCQLRY